MTMRPGPGAAGAARAPHSHIERFALVACLAAGIGVLVPAAAYAVCCILYLWRSPEPIVGRLPLAARNAALVLLALGLALVFGRLIQRLLHRRWLWVPVACLAAASAACTALLYSLVAFTGLCGGGPSARAAEIAARLQRQKGHHLVLPDDVSALEIRDPGLPGERLVLNDRCAQPLFGVNLPKLLWIHAGGDILIDLAPDGRVADAGTTAE